MQYTYSGNNLVKINELLPGSPPTTVTSTYYSYDSQNRLIGVTTDLSPTDNAISDGNVVTTSYTYDGVTNYITSIQQWQGVATTGTLTGRLDIGYDASHRVTSYKQYTSSTAYATTTITYVSSTVTKVTDANGNATTLTYDANDQLVRIDYPAMAAGTPFVTFGYLGNQVISATDANGNQTTYGYDPNTGDMLWQRSPSGDETVWTYDSGNRVVTKTDYAGRDSDAGGTGATPTGAMTTRYAYDTYGNLSYVISATGEVTEYDWYQPYDIMQTKIVYRDKLYDLSTLPNTWSTISYTDAQNFVSTITDKSNAERTNYYYDGTGQLAITYTFASCTTAGVGSYATPITIVSYTHDEHGNLLSRQLDGKNAETYA